MCKNHGAISIFANLFQKSDPTTHKNLQQRGHTRVAKVSASCGSFSLTAEIGHLKFEI
jgi:hypothetical protein